MAASISLLEKCNYLSFLTICLTVFFNFNLFSHFPSYLFDDFMARGLYEFVLFWIVRIFECLFQLVPFHHSCKKNLFFLVFIKHGHGTIWNIEVFCL